MQGAPRPRFGVDFDGSDLTGIDGGASSNAAFRFGGGGDFGGGGASDTWGGGHVSSGYSGGGSSGGSFDFDLDDAWVVVLLVAVLLASLIAALYVVYIAPALLAEIFVDGVLVAGLYHRLRTTKQQYWLRTAVRRTWIPTVALVVFFVCAGLLMHRLVPKAHSMGDVWHGVAESDIDSR